MPEHSRRRLAQTEGDDEPEVEGVVAHVNNPVQIADQPFASPAEDRTVLFPPQLAPNLVQGLESVDESVAEGQPAQGGCPARGCGEGQHHAGGHAVGGGRQIDAHGFELWRKIEISLLFLGTGKRFHRLHKLKEIAGKAAVTPDAAGLFFP